MVMINLTSKNICKNKRGFIAFLPVIMVSAFLLLISTLTASNSYSFVQGRVRSMERMIARQNSFDCALWLDSYTEKINKLKTVNQNLFNKDVLVVGVSLAESDCKLESDQFVRSKGLYSNARFYQDFNIPLLGLYLQSI